MMVVGGVFSLSQNLIHLHLSSNYTFTSNHVNVNGKKTKKKTLPTCKIKCK